MNILNTQAAHADEPSRDAAHWTASLDRILDSAQSEGSLYQHECLSGFSGAKVIALLQRLGRAIESRSDLCYAEIGVFQGLTLLGVAAAAPGLRCFGIDNFSQFDTNGTNKQLVLQRRGAVGASNAELLDLDYEEALLRFAEFSGGRKIGVLFVDGPHDYRSQLLSVALAMPHLDKRAVIVIDDCNYEHVRLATHDLLRMHPDLRFAFEAYTPQHPVFADDKTRKAAEEGWWNGIHVLLRHPEHRSPGPGPLIGRAKERSLNEHLLHSHGVSDEMLALGDTVYELALNPSVSAVRRGLRLLRTIRGRLRARTPSRIGNTHSEMLPSASRHPLS